MAEKAEKLPRPHTPVDVKCRVALRQLGELFVDDVVEAARAERRLGKLLANSIEALRVILGEEGDPQLDHDPQLEQRQKVRDRRGGKIIEYVPRANDPAFLFYRWDHGIKTNVRGDHGQFPDVVIRKRARRRKREPYVTPLGLKVGMTVTGGPFGKRGGKIVAVSRSKVRPPKRKWAKRPLRSKNTLRKKKR